MIFIHIILLTACQEKSEEKKNQFIVSSFTLEDTGERLIAAWAGNKLYYAGGIQNKNKIYVFDIESENTEDICELQEENIDIVLMSASSNNEIVLLNRIIQPNEELISATNYEIIRIDGFGKIFQKYEITNYLTGETDLLSPQGILLDAHGNVYLATNGKNGEVIVFDSLGELRCKIICEGHINKLFLGDKGQVICVYSQYSTEGMDLFVSEVDILKNTLSEIAQLNCENVDNLIMTGSQNQLLISENDLLSQINLENENEEELLNWMDLDIDQANIREIAILNNQNIAALIYRRNADGENSNYKLMILESALKGNSHDKEITDEQEKITLTYATMYLDAEMRTWIVEYNQTHTNCHIAVKEYGGEDYETGLTRLNADIVSGNAPDLIDLSDIDIGSYISNGVLVDLSTFFENSTNTNKENFVPNILQLYENESKIYGVTVGFRLETLIGKKTVLEDNSQWTFDRMRKTIEEMPSENSIIDNLSSIGLLRIVLQSGLNEYVDWENGTCSFESEKFIQLLELANTMNGKVVEGDIEQNLSSGRLLLYRAYISGITDYKEAVDMFNGEEVVCVGYPSTNGGTTLVYPYLPIGISSMCKNQDEAWEFVSSLLGEEFQEKHIHFNFPIRISSLEKEFDLAMNPQNKWEDENTRDLPSQEEVDALYEIINTSYGSLFFDTNIWNIIEEEVAYFFNGTKSSEETAKVIQNRVKLYINENY